MSAKSWYKKRYTPEQIKEIQRTLGVEEDGLIGPDTLRAIKEYQEDAGLKADGLWGKATQAKADEWNEEYNSFVPNRTVNPNEELYKEYADNIEKKYWLDEQNKYESNYNPNYEMSNAELAYLNKEIDKVKKQLADRQAKYESAPQPKTQVGWGSYIANNDSTLLNKYQDAERAWYNKLIDQAHAKELAKAQMEQQSGFDKEARIKDFNNAKVAADTAYQLLRNDNSNDKNVRAKLINDYKSAINNLNYYASKTGNELYELDEDLLNKAIDDETTAIKNVDYGSIDSFDTQAQKDATLREIEANPAFKTDEKLRSTYNTLKDIKPKDVKNREWQAKLQKWLAEYNALNGVPQSKWQKANPEKYKALREAKLIKEKK